MTVDALVDAYLAHHLHFRPVDASFMGLTGHDHRLPPAGPDTAAAERAGLATLREQLAATPAGETPGQRLDRRYVEAELTLTEAALDHAPRLANPAWYSGEAAFGIISLLLPHPGPPRGDAIAARLAAIPAFLAAAEAQLTAAPRAITDRAIRESASFAGYLRTEIRRHYDWNPAWDAAADTAAAAFDRFAAAIAHLADAPAATGRAYLALLMTSAHGLDFTPETALARAEADYARLGDELIALAKANDPARSWQEQVASLSAMTAETPETVIDLYRKLDAKAVAGALDLVTPATEYALEYRLLSPDLTQIAADLYFLPYRSPPAANPGTGSLYWVQPPAGADYLAANAVAPVKIIHAVHHGSIGHHTQNARARTAPSRMARLAGTDCALGLAMLPAGTMVEGWACYAQDLMAEAPGFYSATERVFLKQFERRNAASVIVDIRLHTGEWSPEQAMDFYASAGFAPSRIAAEVTRNAMLPATRLMYWLGIAAIRTLRRRWRGTTAAFHDTLIGHGHVPIAWAADEMALKGQLD